MRSGDRGSRGRGWNRRGGEARQCSGWWRWPSDPACWDGPGIRRWLSGPGWGSSSASLLVGSDRTPRLWTGSERRPPEWPGPVGERGERDGSARTRLRRHPASEGRKPFVFVYLCLPFSPVAPLPSECGHATLCTDPRAGQDCYMLGFGENLSKGSQICKHIHQYHLSKNAYWVTLQNKMFLDSVCVCVRTWAGPSHVLWAWCSETGK